MKPAQLTKRIRYTKPGQTIIVPMGWIYPSAVQVSEVGTDEHGQIYAAGTFVEMAGCSSVDLGRRVEVCLGWAQ